MRQNSITIKYGVGNSLTSNFPIGTTVAELLSKQTVQDALGFSPAAVEAVIDNQVVRNMNTVLEDGDIVTLQTKASTKGNK